MTDFFPFTLHAYDNGHFVKSPDGFKAAFLDNKPEKMSFYAYDVTVKSKTLIEFTVYRMRDVTFGGIGDPVGQFEVVVDPEITHTSIYLRAKNMALTRRAQEILAEEEKTVGQYTLEILKTIGD